MITAWFAHLSWSHATLIVLVFLMLSALIGIAIGKAFTINEPPPSRHPWSTRDYSKEYQEKVEWLGDDFLCAKPVNRRS